MVKRNLKLVSYRRGAKNLGHAELQIMDMRALNTKSSAGFKGPVTVPPDVFNQMLHLKLVEERTAQSDAVRSIYHLTETGRARGLKD